MGAWIETLIIGFPTDEPTRSRPPWARGLKPNTLTHSGYGFPVAPPVGAWIETGSTSGIECPIPSRPPWARGLKLTDFAA